MGLLAMTGEINQCCGSDYQVYTKLPCGMIKFGDWWMFFFFLSILVGATYESGMQSLEPVLHVACHTFYATCASDECSLPCNQVNHTCPQYHTNYMYISYKQHVQYHTVTAILGHLFFFFLETTEYARLGMWALGSVAESPYILVLYMLMSYMWFK